MKLNNKGWELNEMVAMTAILFILLGVATFYIYRLYSTLNSTNDAPLETLEAEINAAAKNYYYDSDLEDNIIITYDVLKSSGYIKSFYKKYGVDCNGYVVKKITFKPYIKCGDVMTLGYNEDYD